MKRGSVVTTGGCPTCGHKTAKVYWVDDDGTLALHCQGKGGRCGRHYDQKPEVKQRLLFE